MHVCACIRIYVCMYICACMCIYVCIHASIYVGSYLAVCLSKLKMSHLKTTQNTPGCLTNPRNKPQLKQPG